tara:strand:- start:540 stop:2246 length:1707 start_codon:yes stop_codon:yes gene_type:complete
MLASDVISLPEYRWSCTMNIHRFYLTALIAGILAACGGGDPLLPDADESDVVDEEGGAGTEGETAENTSSYYPLQFYLDGEGYTDESGVFGGVWFSPLVHGYIISPVHAETLAPLENPDINNFVVTVDGESVSAAEQGLMMQKIIGMPVNLRTAIVIDTSASNSEAAGVSVTALVNEVKDYIAAAQASSNPIIAEQQFTLVAYADAGDGVEALVPDLTSDSATLYAALDALPATWNDRGSSTATYEAIVRSVGRYVGTGSGGVSSDIDLFSDDLDDLTESYVYDGSFWTNDAFQLTGVNVSSIVLVSAGGNTNTQAFFKEDALTALNWQSLLQFVEEDNSDASDEDQSESESEEDQTDTESSGDEISDTKSIGKPLIYVSVADSEVDPSVGVGELAAEIINTNSLTSFSFAPQVIAAQERTLSERLKLDNQYLVRYVVFERDGSHEAIFKSESNGYNYTLTTDIDMSDGSFLTLPQGEAAVEIAGPKNVYLPSGSVSLTNVTNLHPATRWTVASYEPADYSWTVDGQVRSKNADGSITITTDDIGSVVVLTNNSLSSGATTASLTVVE